MNKLILPLAAAAAMAFTGVPAQEATAGGIHLNTGGLHLDIGNPHRGIGYANFGRRTSYRSLHAINGWGRSWHVGQRAKYHPQRRHVTRRWHDTTHFDYIPGGYVPHGDHYDYIPGRHVLHVDGHWDYHGHGRRGRHH